MSIKRKNLNLLLLTISVLMGWLAACLYRRPPVILDPMLTAADEITATAPDTAVIVPQPESATKTTQLPETDTTPAISTAEKEMPVQQLATSTFDDIEPRNITADHPFSREAAKLLSGRLEETDSVSRHKILSYCEHLRTSYTTRDIDFIRQVFSNNALIIVGHMVRTSNRPAEAIGNNSKVIYHLRSKREYLAKLSRIFDSGKPIDVNFSDFRIMRHPTMEGIYGVTLRQKYSCGSYSDDGYLFLLWDFRNMSMPLIHVRTWQPSMSENPDDDDIIGIGDFNLE